MPPLTRKLATLAITLLLAMTALGGCGFDLATDRVYTPAAGVNNRDGTVDVLNAVVVSTKPGSGTFIASLSNNSTDKPATLSDVSGEGLTIKVKPIEIPPAGFVNLADPPAKIKVTGEFEAGGFVDVTLDFAGERASLNVPVLPNADEYADLDGPAPAPSETPTAEH